LTISPALSTSPRKSNSIAICVSMSASVPDEFGSLRTTNG
jgi:hypothetical protein